MPVDRLRHAGLGIDRFLNEGRILTTVLGNAVATVFIAKWEGEFDLERAKAVPDGKDVGPVPDPDVPALAAMTTDDSEAAPAVAGH
ncbi:hypothetical protein [Streptomyces scopuliridis]|uniref:hypothetical protein n=1 Tax=Streptomyces scopuliridis TaxID=452529 RepID=UPI0004C1DFDC|nr:hypothetical protein [Streptomyces scopuliridis]